MTLVPEKAAFIPNLLTGAHNTTRLDGFESGVLQTVMQRTLNQKRWRAFLIRTAMFTALWLVVAFLFATEFYLSARGMPMSISWTDGARSAFRVWLPWVLLSPIAVILAERFRFDRDSWGRSLVIHLAACFFLTIAYAGLFSLASPALFILSTGGVDGGLGIVSTNGAMLPGKPGFGDSVQGIGLPPPPQFPASPNAVIFSPGKPHAGVGPPMTLSATSGPVTLGRGEGLPPLPLPAGGVGFLNFRPINKWTQFLHLVTLRMQFTVPTYLCIICICWVINHFQETSERERRTLELETRLTQANLQALKMQLQPHFLFNTLNAISSLIHENPTVADDMVGSLSQFLRTTLDVSSENEVPLRSELQFVDRYLEIQQTRFGDRLRVRREVDPKTMDALVPPLILQPLLENAIRHGIESREAGGTVTIQAVREGDLLRLQISDDGEGFKGGQLMEIQTGIGLSNTKTRLQELYGEKHQFKMTANQSTGACVKIEFPFRLSQSAKQNEA